MIDGFVQVETEVALKAVENYNKIEVQFNNIKQQAKNAINLNWFDKLFRRTKDSKFGLRVALLDWNVLEYLWHEKFVNEDMYDSFDKLYEWKFKRDGIQNLCSVNSEYVYLSPSQAKFVNEYGEI